ncbi:helix-turn-helix transcriptional regulator [Nocardia niwae]|uniref:helix-turn-helix transcriptional regulator n=1 Tax=Nocardia niwae TaxID=626084 RepID=UPI000B01FA87|nr:helix-turn-helix domain-containing protein [Nocardia niwae]
MADTTVQWLTRRQVAAMTGYSPRTLETWALSKPRRGPKCFKVANVYRYPVDEVRAWMAQQQRTAA